MLLLWQFRVLFREDIVLNNDPGKGIHRMESLSKTEKAVKQWEELVVRQITHLGKTHQFTMLPENNYARTYDESNEKNKTLHLLKSMFHVRHEGLGEANAHRVWAEESWESRI